MKAIEIKTYRSFRDTTERKAILHAARVARYSDIPRAIRAPRGTKGRLVRLAAAAREYRESCNPDRLLTPLSVRLEDRLIATGEAEITTRALSVPSGWNTFGKGITRDGQTGYYLLYGSGWYEYSSRVGSYYQRACYLIGRDEGQLFAARVPSSISTVSAAIDWLTPRAIHQARDKGLPTHRQGDIFFRPVRGLQAHDMSAIDGTAHTARPRKDGGLSITHPQHKCRILSGKYRWRAYRSTQIASSGRTYAD